MQNNQYFQSQQQQQQQPHQQLPGGPSSAQPLQNPNLQRSPLLLPQTEDIAVINKLLETLSNSLNEQWDTVDTVLELVDQIQIAKPETIPNVFSDQDEDRDEANNNNNNNNNNSHELITQNNNGLNHSHNNEEDNDNSGLDTAPILDETNRIEYLQLANQNLRTQIQITQAYTSIQARLIETYLHGIEKILGLLRTFVARKLGQTLDLHQRRTAQIERLQDDSADIILRNAQLEGGIFKVMQMLRTSLRRICEESDNNNNNNNVTRDSGSDTGNISSYPMSNGTTGHYHSETRQNKTVGLTQFRNNIVLQAEFLNAEINIITAGLADLKKN